jgi:exodeoxyribonuclease VII large subunit
MPVATAEKKVFSLYEVTRSIQKTLSERYSSAFWVKAEMIKLNHYSHSGHCYPDLVEKKNGKVIAQMKSVLWKTDYQRIDAKFQHILKEPLKDGINILFFGTISFDPQYGLSLVIVDIDPTYSLGELEREKQETIQKLQNEGIFALNKSRVLPLLPQRIAVISVETSKGYADYLKMLDQNPAGYKFFNFLFPSLLQGEKSVTSIISQLRKIKDLYGHFDAVAIIRGGGGDLGLSSYNSYQLAREIALFPIPVFTGIGHSTNETVSEMVSFKNAITPTELADFLLKKFENFSLVIQQASGVISEHARQLVAGEKLVLENTVKYFQAVTKNRLLTSKGIINSSIERLSQYSRFVVRENMTSLDLSGERLKALSFRLLKNALATVTESSQRLAEGTLTLLNDQKKSINRIGKTVSILDPVNILNRGFTITLRNGKSLKHTSEVNPGEEITTILANGNIISTVSNIIKSEKS